jgi:hypothetical protein
MEHSVKTRIQQLTDQGRESLRWSRPSHQRALLVWKRISELLLPILAAIDAAAELDK